MAELQDAEIIRQSFVNEAIAKEKDKFVLVIGDSHGIDIFNSLSALSKKTLYGKMLQ